MHGKSFVTNDLTLQIIPLRFYGRDLCFFDHWDLLFEHKKDISSAQTKTNQKQVI